MRRAFHALLLLIAQPAFTQGLPNPSDAAFFTQDRNSLMLACADAARTLGATDADRIAEYGWAQLIAGNRDKADAAFHQAIGTGGFVFKGVTLMAPPGQTKQTPGIGFNKAEGAGAETYRIIGLAYLRQGLKAEALKAYEVMADAENRGFLSKQGTLTRAAVDLIRAGFVKEATRYADQAHLLEAKDSDNSLDFAEAALAAGERDLAARYFAYAVKADPKDGEVWMRIAQAYAGTLSSQLR